MSTITRPILDSPGPVQSHGDHTPRRILGRFHGSGRIVIGGGVLLLIVLACLVTLPLTGNSDGPLYFDRQSPYLARVGPQFNRVAYERANGLKQDPLDATFFGRISLWFGTDAHGRSLLGRCLMGGVISLTIGIAAAAISVVLGVAVGLFAGYRGGWVDSLLMRSVDILYGLPYILLVVLFKIALEPRLTKLEAIGMGPRSANLVVLFLAIGLVSWLTMARVIRGQVLSLRSLPFIEACRAAGLGEWRIFTRHLLPNLIGPISVYATLTVPQAILQESFLSFLGIGVQPPIPTWGLLASEGLIPGLNSIHHHWYMLIVPCVLLSVTLLSLNFLGDGLRDVFDPKREAAKI
jgi:oligopeptide transport system permease protein